MPIRRVGHSVGFGLLFLGLGVCSDIGPAHGDSSRPIEYWTIEPNEGQSAGGHSAIRIADTIFHVEHRGDGLLVDRRDPIGAFERVYRLEGNRSIEVHELELPASVAIELESRLRHRYFERKRRLDELGDLEEDVRWLDRAIESGHLEVFVPGAGLLARAPDRCTRNTAKPRADRRKRIARRYGAGWFAARVAEARAERHRALRNATGVPMAGSTHASVSPRPGTTRALMEATQRLTALEAVQHCRTIASQRLVSLFPDKPNGERPQPGEAVPAEKAWDSAAVQAELEAQFMRLLGNDRPDSGLAILLSWTRLAAIDQARATGTPWILDPIADATGDRDNALHSLPNEWRTLRKARARASLSEAIHLLDLQVRQPIEVRLFRIEAARHALAHALAEELHRGVHPESILRVTRATRYAGALIELPWPEGLTLDHLRARRRVSAALADLKRRELNQDLGYALFTRNCVTELFAALDEALATNPLTTSFSAKRARDPEAFLGFIPVVAGRIAGRQLPVKGKHRLSSWRELALDATQDHETQGLARALRESNTLSTTTYPRNPQDSIFLFFSQDPIWLRPLMGVANLVTGIAAAAVGVLVSPLDRGQVAKRGVEGILISIPELVFFNIRKGSYAMVPPTLPPDQDSENPVGRKNCGQRRGDTASSGPTPDPDLHFSEVPR